MGIASPIEQFEIHALSPTLFHLAGQPVTFTNSAFWMMFSAASAGFFMLYAMRRQAVIPGRLQMFAEMLFNMIAGTLLEAAGPKAKAFIPFIFTIFMFVFSCNLWGLFPHSLTVTAHIVVNFALALTVLLTVIVTGFVKHGPSFIRVFVPHGVPPVLLPFLSMIEFISFWVRSFSLSLRLFGNMLAGHILLKVFAGMTAAIATSGWVATAGIFPLLLNIIIVAFELFVAGLQAYVFTVLSSVYLRDALEMH